MSMQNMLPWGDGASPAIVPSDMTAGANGRWINVRDINDSLYIYLQLAAGGAAPTISLQQAQDSAGTGVKALSIERLFYKVGATAISSALGSKDIFIEDTTVSESAPAATYSLTAIGGATNESNICIRVRPQDLDHANGFGWVRVVVAAAAGKYLSALYLPCGKAQTGRLVATPLA